MTGLHHNKFNTAFTYSKVFLDSMWSDTLWYDNDISLKQKSETDLQRNISCLAHKSSLCLALWGRKTDIDTHVPLGHFRTHFKK